MLMFCAALLLADFVLFHFRLVLLRRQVQRLGGSGSEPGNIKNKLLFLFRYIS